MLDEAEIERSTSAILLWKCWGILRHLQKVYTCVSRSSNVGIEENRRLVVTGVRTTVPDRVEDLGTENPTVVVAGKGFLKNG
jgi:hypothetical protein